MGKETLPICLVPRDYGEAVGWALHSEGLEETGTLWGLLESRGGTEAVIFHVCIYETTAFFLSGVGGTVSQNRVTGLPAGAVTLLPRAPPGCSGVSHCRGL